MTEPLFRNLDELIDYFLTYLPEGTIGEDNDGQLIIYTNLFETDQGTLASFHDYGAPDE